MKDMNKICFYLYGLFVATVFLQAHIYTLPIAFIGVMAAVIIAYRMRKESTGTHYESHFHWIIRTFWIGTGVYMPVITLIAAAYVVKKTDLSTLQARIDAGESLTNDQMYEIVLQQNSALIEQAMIVTTVIFSLWWLWRCWVGYDSLKDGKPVPKVNRWF